MKTFIRLHEPTFGEDEISAVVNVMRSGRITSGDKVKEFERRFSPHAVMVNSGSSANLLAVGSAVSLGILNPGDEVIVPALSWSTSIWPLVQHGLVPVIVDIDPETLNIDPDKVEAAITSKTRGIVVIHVYGNPCDMDQLKTFRERGLWVMSDSCEALGAKGIKRHSDVQTYSFYFSHHITTGEGGLVDTEDDGIAEPIRIMRGHGWIRDCANPSPWVNAHPDIDPRFLFVDAGYNLRCTEMQAAMGLVQLGKLELFLEQRRHIGNMLDRIMKRFEWLTVQKQADGSSRFGYPIIVKKDAPFKVRDLRNHLESHGIETRPIICGNIARQPGLHRYQHHVPFPTPHSDHVMDYGFAVGCHQGMKEIDCSFIGYEIDHFMKNLT